MATRIVNGVLSPDIAKPKLEIHPDRLQKRKHIGVRWAPYSGVFLQRARDPG